MPNRSMRLWRADEEKYMLEKYAQIGPQQVALNLNRSYKSVVRKAHEMGLYSRHRERKSAEEREKTQQAKAERRKIYLANPENMARHKESVRVSSSDRRKRRREGRLCIRCGAPSLEHSAQYCLFHWVCLAGYGCGHYDEGFGQKLLEKLNAQNYQCALTGDILVPGLNASIDHIIPKSKGGAKDDLDNLQWVTVHANHAKYECTVEEFVEFCRRVVSLYDRRR